VTFSNHFTRLRVDAKRLDPIYLARWLTRQQQCRVFEGLCTRWVGQSAVRTEKLLRLQIPLLPLAVQKRIADILDKADSIRRNRQQARFFTQELPIATFRETFRQFLNPNRESVPLSEVAEVVSGVAKGRKLNGDEVREVPYLRVANVQAGFLDLSEIKTIPAKATEIDALALQRGDVVMTEGGDHDKLGRGALWEYDIPDCIHQNHIFRVRTNRERMLPTFFVNLLQTEVVKSYFLRCAKKTTNLASINMRQLRALLVPLPPIRLQERFERELQAIRQLDDRQKSSEAQASELFGGLVQRAFRGEL
jgi:type I restriction enzyme S subunit